jgi:septum formation protein
VANFKLEYPKSLLRTVSQLIGERNVRLASQSPRRAEILSMLGVSFEQFSPATEEQLVFPPALTDPIIRSRIAAGHKAAEGATGMRDGLVIAGDTIVVLDGDTLAKPADRDEAVSHLNRLSGRSHCVYSSIALRKVSNGEESVGTAESIVKFHALTDRQIVDYVETGEPDDKAGAYGIQGMGKFLVENYTGWLDTIIGFPARLFANLLESLLSVGTKS